MFLQMLPQQSIRQRLTFFSIDTLLYGPPHPFLIENIELAPRLSMFQVSQNITSYMGVYPRNNN